MDSLVADYGSSDESGNEEGQNFVISNSQLENKEETLMGKNTKDGVSLKNKKAEPMKKPKKLLNPLLKKKAAKALLQSSSVFNNPFQIEMDNKKSILEKHVKMTDNPKELKQINGKKICWNHRKGKCRFGQNCKYAHQSDIPGQYKPPKYSGHNESIMPEHSNFIDQDQVDSFEDNKSRKRKPGLADGLIPNKKSISNFKRQQNSEQPWLNHDRSYS